MALNVTLELKRNLQMASSTKLEFNKYNLYQIYQENYLDMDSGCGSVGRAVASKTRGTRFKSSHRQKFIYILNICLLSTVCRKDENKGKRGREWPIFLKKQS